MAKPRRTMTKIRAAAALRKEQEAAARLARQQQRAANREAKRLRTEAARARRHASALRRQAEDKAQASRRDAAERMRRAKDNGYVGGVHVDIPRTELMERLNTVPFAGAEAVPVTNTGGIAPEARAVDPINAYRLVSVADRVNFVDPAFTAGRQEWAIYSGASETVEDDIIAMMSTKNAHDFEDDLVEKLLGGTATFEELVMLALLWGMDINELFAAKAEKCEAAEDGETDSDVRFAERVSQRKTESRKDHGKRKGHRKEIREFRTKKRNMRRDQRIEHAKLQKLEAKYGRWCRKTVKPISQRIIWRSIVAAKKAEPIVDHQLPHPNDLFRLEAYRRGPDLDAWRAWITPLVEARAEAARKEARAQRKAEKKRISRAARSNIGPATVDLVVCPRKKARAHAINLFDLTVP